MVPPYNTDDDDPTNPNAALHPDYLADLNDGFLNPGPYPSPYKSSPAYAYPEVNGAPEDYVYPEIEAPPVEYETWVPPPHLRDEGDRDGDDASVDSEELDRQTRMTLAKDIMGAVVGFCGVLAVWYLILFAYCALCGIGISYLEHDEQPYADVYTELRDAGIDNQEARLIMHDLNIRYHAPYTMWNWWGSTWHFMMTISTVGYGTYAPITEAGQMYTVFLGIFGIPIFLLAATRFSDVLRNVVRTADRVRKYVQSGFLGGAHNKPGSARLAIEDLDGDGTLNFIELKLGLYKISGKDPSWSQVYDCLAKCDIKRGWCTIEESKQVIRVWLDEAENSYSRAVFFSALLLYVANVLIGGAIMAVLEEDWSYGGGVYWAHITATTIGFGDFAPYTLAGQIYGFFFIPFAVGVTGFVIGAASDKFKGYWDRKDETSELIANLDLGHGKGEMKSERSPIWRFLLNFFIIRFFTFLALIWLGAACYYGFEHQYWADWSFDWRRLRTLYTTNAQTFLNESGLGDFLYSDPFNWWESAMIAFTVVTTIGYGNITIYSPAGQFFTVVYSVIGIALSGYLLAINVSDGLDLLKTARPLKQFLSGSHVERDAKRRLARAHNNPNLDLGPHRTYTLTDIKDILMATNRGRVPKNRDIYYAWLAGRKGLADDAPLPYENMLVGVTETLNERAKSRRDETFDMVLCFVLLFIWVQVMALAFRVLEDEDFDDSYFTSSYFMWITVATIGYGDYAPTKFSSWIVLVLSSYIGLPLFAIVFGTLAVKMGRLWKMFMSFCLGKSSAFMYLGL